MLTIVWFTLIAGGIYSAWVGAESAPFEIIAAWWVGIAISHVTRTMAEQDAGMLDERMLAIRNSAFRTAYYGFGGLVVAILFVFSNLGETLLSTSTMSLDAGAISGAVFVVLIILMYLPSVILAWSEDII